MKDFDKKYFLGANSCEGFYSEFSNCYRPEDGWKAYIIKGGPGTGKSSFMKFVAAKATEKNIECELCICSSDPNSLDGVILPEMKIAILDGTAPHIVEPTYPGVCEEILNFGSFWNDKIFNEDKTKIIEISNKNKTLHKMASRYLQACGQLILDNYKIAVACTDELKVATFANKLCENYIPRKPNKKTGNEWVRFTQGITPLGIVCYSKTISDSVNKIIPICDEYGSASGLIMNAIKDYAIIQGYDIITIKNAFLPKMLIDHIIIPELSIAFVSESQYQHFDITERRIHARRFVNNTQLHNSRKRMQFNKKAIKQLLISACETLAQAKATHDELEKYYISSMNFKDLTNFANKFADNLLKDK